MPDRKMGEQYYCYSCLDRDSTWENRLFLTLVPDKRFEMIMDHFDNSKGIYRTTRKSEGTWDQTDSSLHLTFNNGIQVFYKFEATRMVSSGVSGSKEQYLSSFIFDKASDISDVEGCNFFQLDQNNRLTEIHAE